MDILKTYRYLRLAIVALVVLLFTSLVIEWVQAGGSCWRTSISSSYYTPVRGVLVGVLVAVGVCTVAIKGNTDVDDILLDLAGGLAPVVAFVPIQDPHECVSAAPGVSAAGPNTTNNIGAYLVLAVLVLVGTVWIARRESPTSLTGWPLVGLLVAIGTTVLGGGAFLFARTTFDRLAHYAAAIPLFICIMAVIVANAVSYARSSASGQAREPARGDYANRYLALAVVLAVSVGAMLVVRWVTGWAHAILWVEGVVIALFAVFWVIQTIELWDEPAGLRADPRGVLAQDVGTQ